MGAGCLLPCSALRAASKRRAHHGRRRHVERSKLFRQHAVVLQPVSLATFGTVALFRHIERGGRRWLVLAGLCGGLSFLVKSVGICFVVAGGLFLLFRAQIQSDQDTQTDVRVSTGFLLLEAAACLGLVIALVSLLGERRTVMDVLHFVVPLAAMMSVLLWCEWREGRGDLQTRVRRRISGTTPRRARW